MNQYVLFTLALLPILWLVVTLGASLLKAHHAAFTTLIITIGVSILFFGLSSLDTLTAALEGASLGVWPIMAVIISAIFTYKLALHTKSIEVINKMLSGISTDRRIQVLILAWGFGGFLEAISGYGTSVAIPAGILIALGCEPLFAAVICLIANTVPTAFGAVGIPVTTLAKVTELEAGKLSLFISLQLSIFVILMPFVLVMIIGGGIKGLKGVWGITLVSGIAFVIPQILGAAFLNEELPTLLGSLCSMGATIFWALKFNKDKQQPYKNKTSSDKNATCRNNENIFLTDNKELLSSDNPNINNFSSLNSSTIESHDKITTKMVLTAWLPYILITFFILITSPLIPPVSEALGHIKSIFTIYTGKNAVPMTFKWINSPGTLIMLAAIISGFIQGAKLKEMVKVFLATLKQMLNSTITVLSIVAVARVMSYSGMIASIASILVKATGSWFPLISPLLGTLGTFVTGSDTSSNVLFGALQRQVADSIHVNPYWLSAANTSGATAGKMISPQSIAVAASATGMAGFEGKIFGKTIKFCAVYVLVLGVLIYVGSKFV